MTAIDPEPMRAALRRTASALKRAGYPFALCGGYALWAHGAPEPSHDVDFLISEHDVDAVADALAEAGLEVRRTPEDWLFKVDTDGVVVDIIHRASLTGTTWALERAETFEVLSVQMPVMLATDVVASKLCALSEHFCDFGALLPVVRAVREQIDWATVSDEVKGNDFAAAFLFLAQRLGVAPPAA